MTAVAAGLPDAAQVASRERVAEAVDAVLSRGEFREEPRFFAELLEEFFGWLGELFDVPVESVESGVQVLWIVLAVVAGAALAWFAVSVARSRAARRAAGATAELAEVARRVAELRAEARRAQEAGELTRALRLYFFALVVGLGELGELEYDDAWTNRELLLRGEPDAEIARRLGPLVGELDAHSFGGRPTEPAEVERFAGLCEELLGRTA